MRLQKDLLDQNFYPLFHNVGSVVWLELDWLASEPFFFLLCLGKILCAFLMGTKGIFHLSAHSFGLQVSFICILWHCCALGGINSSGPSNAIRGDSLGNKRTTLWDNVEKISVIRIWQLMPQVPIVIPWHAPKMRVVHVALTSWYHLRHMLVEIMSEKFTTDPIGWNKK